MINKYTNSSVTILEAIGFVLVAIMLVLFISLLFVKPSHADDIDGTDAPKVYRTHFYVGFANKETTAAEIVWQMLNVVDTLQTLQIAKNPKCYQEVGQLSIISNHPSTNQVYVGMAAFAAFHYLVAKGIDHLVVGNPDYMVIQRVFQYSNLAYKAYTIESNAHYGIGMTHSPDCVR